MCNPKGKVEPNIRIEYSDINKNSRPWHVEDDMLAQKHLKEEKAKDVWHISNN
jgi:hypothetical protein